MKLVFAAFLCVCAWEDFREKKISVLFLWAAASVAAAWTAGYYMILLDWADMHEAHLWLAMRGAHPGNFTACAVENYERSSRTGRWIFLSGFRDVPGILG